MMVYSLHVTLTLDIERRLISQQLLPNNRDYQLLLVTSYTVRIDPAMFKDIGGDCQGTSVLFSALCIFIATTPEDISLSNSLTSGQRITLDLR